MLIKKLNSMFHKHSRWLFGLFTIVIIISFVGFFTPGQFGFGDFGGDSATAGVAFGDKVSYGELRELQMPVYILSGQRDVSWRQLFELHCKLVKAEAMGLGVSDRELVELLRQNPDFQQNGRFDLEKYREALQRMGITEEDFVRALRMQMLMAKLNSSLVSGIVVTPDEARDLYRQVNAKYAVKAAVFKPESFRDQVALSGSEVKKFFEANRASYQIPGMFDALIADFPYSAYLAESEKQASDAVLQKFYELNRSAFTDQAGKELPFASARAEVRKLFIEQNARLLARRAATRFASGIYEQMAELEPGEREACFRNAAASAGIELTAAQQVSYDAEAVGKLKSRLLVARLARENSFRLTNEIIGDDAVYLGFVLKQVKTRPAELGEVANKVKDDYVRAQEMRKAMEFVERSRAELLAITDVARREAAFGALKNCEYKTFGFSLLNQPAPVGLESAAAAVIDLAPGEIAPPVATDDAVQLALLIKRVPADMADFEKNQAQFVELCRMGKLQLLEQALGMEFATQCRWLGGEEK